MIVNSILYYICVLHISHQLFIVMTNNKLTVISGPTTIPQPPPMKGRRWKIRVTHQNQSTWRQEKSKMATR